MQNRTQVYEFKLEGHRNIYRTGDTVEAMPPNVTRGIVAKIISATMNDDGTVAWVDLTEAHTGKQRSLPPGCITSSPKDPGKAKRRSSRTMSPEAAQAARERLSAAREAKRGIQVRVAS